MKIQGEVMRKELIRLIRRTAFRLLNIGYSPIKITIANKHEFQLTYYFSQLKNKWILDIIYLKAVTLAKETSEKLFYKIVRVHGWKYEIQSN